MFQIIANSLFIASGMARPKRNLPREADLPRLNVPVGWGSLSYRKPDPAPRRPGAIRQNVHL